MCCKLLFLLSYFVRCDQNDTLVGNESSLDISTEENLKRLVEIGKEMLEKPVSRVNLETGKYE